MRLLQRALGALALLCAALGAPAPAQTPSSFVQGQTLPAAALNNAFALKKDFVTCTTAQVGCLDAIASGFSPTDPASWAQSFVRIGTPIPLVGGGTLGSANQFGLNIQVTIPSTGSPANYEKAAIIAYCYTSDASAGLSITRDCVGADTRGIINSSNSLGRAWGGVDLAQVTAGGDGYLTGREIDLTNNGTDQPLIDTTTSKYGLTIVPRGSAPSTVAIRILSGGSTFHKGLFSDIGSFVTVGADANATFIELLGTWIVKTNGVHIQTARTNGVIDAFQSNTGGTSSIVVGVLPATGSTADNAGLNFSFVTTNGSQYTGSSISSGQTNATFGAQTADLRFAVATAGGANANVYTMTAAAFAPTTSGASNLGSTVNKFGSIFGNLHIPVPVTFATLPTCTGAGTVGGAVAVVNDSNTNTWGAVIAGSGAFIVLAFCDGVAWSVAGK